MAAVEANIVATAMPTIVAELGGFTSFGWVFAAYLLSQSVTVPIYGRLADLYGRKRVFFAGAGIFLTFSLLCGLATSMPMLILFRALQGLGAGAIVPITQIIVADIYSPTARAKVQGHLAAVWAVSAMIGPLLGAVIVEHLGWPPVFWVNLPVGVVAILMLALFLRETPVVVRHAVDLRGAVLLVLASGSLMLALLQGQSLGGWIAAPLLAAGLGAVLLVWQEQRAPEPLLPLSLWGDRTILAGNLGACAIGAVMMGITAFLPAFVQGVMGYGAFTGGVMIGLMSLVWAFGSWLAGRLVVGLSYRLTATSGGVALVLGTLVLAGLDRASGPLWAGIAAGLVGFGMGMCNTTFIVAVQNAARFEVRGIATASTVFTRFLGAALGSAVLGAVLNLNLARLLPGSGDPIQSLIDPQRRAALDAGEVERLIAGVAGALHGVYAAAVALALLALAIAWLTPAGLRAHSPDPLIANRGGQR
jgi:EmrB/QacA subfamily drug resistance transporter